MSSDPLRGVSGRHNVQSYHLLLHAQDNYVSNEDIDIIDDDDPKMRGKNCVIDPIKSYVIVVVDLMHSPHSTMGCPPPGIHRQGAAGAVTGEMNEEIDLGNGAYPMNVVSLLPSSGKLGWFSCNNQTGDGREWTTTLRM